MSLYVLFPYSLSLQQDLTNLLLNLNWHHFYKLCSGWGWNMAISATHPNGGCLQLPVTKWPHNFPAFSGKSVAQMK